MELEFKEYIAIGEKKAGKQTELAKMLGISEAYIRTAKTGKRGLPVPICIKLADYINEDRLQVIAASDLITEKDEEKRKILKSCFSRAASVTAAAIVISILTLAPASPIHAASKIITMNNIYYWQLDRRRKFRRKSDLLADFFYMLLTFFQRNGSLSY